MEKIKKIIIIALLSASIMGNSIYYCYADTLSATVDLGGGLATMSAGGTAAALVSVEAALPFILCALGIAGFAYIAGKANLITTIYEQVKSGTEDFCYEVKDAQGITQRYFKTLYCKGKNYVDEIYLKAIAQVAIEEGLFEGVSHEYEFSYDQPDNLKENLREDITVNDFGTLEEVIQYIQYVLDNVVKNESISIYNEMSSNLNLMTSYLSGIYNLSATYGYVQLYSGSNRQVTVYTIDNNNFPISGVYHVDYNNFFYYDNLINNNNTFTYTGYLYDFYYGNNPTPSAQTYSNIRGGWGLGRLAGRIYYLDCYSLGLEKDRDLVFGVPVTDNIPVEEDGAITLPVWENPALTVEDALPVTIPIGYEYPCVWDPELVADPVMPDILDPDLDWSYPLPLEDDPAYPQDDAQPVSQEGDVTDTPAIDYPYYPQNDTFMLPDTIKTKFPFCVPFDMVKCVNSLTATRAAPHYEWNYNIAGMTGTAVIDLSRFDSAAEVLRRCELVAFVIGLIAGTKSLLGDRSG